MLGLEPAELIDFTLVVSELATNSVRHGGGSGILRLWREGPYAVCEVRDRGVITDPLVGLRRPDFRKGSGEPGCGRSTASAPWCPSAPRRVREPSSGHTSRSADNGR